VLKAEFVGIVRLSRPAVGAGTVLAEDRELAYVESLGIRNPVRSGGPGRISAVFVNDGEPVGYGQPLFEIESGR
jgi:biotin carboxyl carrier protein